PLRRRWVEWVRKRWPLFLWRPMRICGPPISNAESGVCFDPQLPPDVRRQAFLHLAREVHRSAGSKPALFFKEFRPEADAEYAGQLDQLWFFAVSPRPGTELVLRWASFEDYLSAMQKRYRKRIRSDLKAADELEFRLLDSFAELAPAAAMLYRQV